MGPKQAIIRRIFEQLMTEKDFSSLWISLGDFQAIRFRSNTDFHSTRVIHFCTMGFLSFMHFHVLSIGLTPISPFLFQLLIDGCKEFLIDEQYLSCLDANVLRSLQPWLLWPKKGLLPTAGDLGTLLAVHEIDVCPLYSV
jgi:hypothetical protein